MGVRLDRAAAGPAGAGRDSVRASADGLGPASAAPVGRRDVGRRSLDLVERRVGLGARALGASAQIRAGSTRSRTTSTAVTRWSSSPASGGPRTASSSRRRRRSTSRWFRCRVVHVGYVRPVGPHGVFVPPPPGSLPGVIVPCPVGTPPAVVLSAPPVVRPGMVVRPVARGGVVEVVAPAGVTREGRAGHRPGSGRRTRCGLGAPGGGRRPRLRYATPALRRRAA